MTPEERDIIVNFISRVGGAPAAAPSGSLTSVPSTTAPLPPIDPDADALIGDQFARYPQARYRLTQLAFVQEHALAEAQNRLKQMQYELQQAQQAAQQAAAQQPQQSRGFLGGLFGGSSAPPPQQPQGVWGQGPGGNQPPPNWQQQAPPQPQYAPGYQQGMLPRQGSGFLGSALTTAAGVAGGLVVGNALMDMFSPRHEGGGMFGGGQGASSPWGGGGALPEPPVPPQAGYVDQGSWSTPDSSAPSSDSSWADSQPSQPDQSSWADSSGGGGGSDWASDTSGGGGSDDDTSV